MSNRFDLQKVEGLLQAVDSSHIDAIGYINEASTLLVKFNTGKVYSYHPVTDEAFLMFQQSDSKGQWLHKNIKNNDDITYEKLN